MEFYSLFNIVWMSCVTFQAQDVEALYIGAIGGFVLWLGLFILQGFGLYRMAKNRGIGNRFLAFVPFASIYYIGKLGGTCDLFGQKVKRAGLYAMLAQILTTTVCLLTIASQIYLYEAGGAPQYDQWGAPYWTGLTGFLSTVDKFYAISGYILSILQLVYQVLLLILLTGLYKKYYPKNYFFLGILVLFVPISHYIVIFVLRNRKAIDFEAYMRARREAYMRQRQQYQNPYSNPYNRYNQNPYSNPYGNPYGQQQNPYYQPQPSKPEEPFGEFATDKKPSGNGEQNGGGNSQSERENPFEDF